MLKVFFPGGDQLVAPNSLAALESQYVYQNIPPKFDGSDASRKFLSRIFCMVNLEDAGIK